MYAYNEAAVAEMNFTGVPGMVGRALMVAATNKIVDDIDKPKEELINVESIIKESSL